MIQNLVTYLTGSGSIGAIVLLLLIAAAIDFITGLAKGWKEGTLKSRVAKEGLLRKFSMFAVVAVCWVVEAVLPIDLGGGICKAAALFFTTSEALSVIENADALGAPAPRFIADRLESAQNLIEGNKEETDNENCN